MPTQFRLNNSGIADLLEQESMSVDLEVRTQKIAALAKASAPYSARDEEAEHYRESISSGVYRESHVGRFGEDSRPTGYVFADVAWACYVESKHRTLADALDTGGR